jgi:phage shock protein A
MFDRLVRLFKSFFNRFITAAEDPVMILENNIREMRNQVPKLNEGIAKAKGTEILLTRQHDQFAAEEKTLRAKLKAAAMSGEDAIGRELAMQLQRVMTEKEKTKAALTQAKDGVQKLMDLRETQVRKINAEIEKIRDTIESAKVAKLKGELAEVFETFQVGDIAYSNQEMLEKLEKEAATNEGKLAAASESVDMKSIKLDMKAEELQAEELYNQFKAEMNIDIASDDTEKKTKEQSKVGTTE